MKNPRATRAQRALACLRAIFSERARERANEDAPDKSLSPLAFERGEKEREVKKKSLAHHSLCTLWLKRERAREREPLFPPLLLSFRALSPPPARSTGQHGRGPQATGQAARAGKEGRSERSEKEDLLPSMVFDANGCLACWTLSPPAALPLSLPLLQMRLPFHSQALQHSLIYLLTKKS